MWHSYQEVNHKVRGHCTQGAQYTNSKVKSTSYSSYYMLSLLPTGSPTVVIDGYTHHSTLTSEDSVPLGTQLILVCQVVGLPYGTPFSYTWTCPNRTCEQEEYYGRKVYNEHILAVSTTSTSDRGTYTCQVTATGGQEANGSFTLSVTGECRTTTVSVMNWGTGDVWHFEVLIL